MTFYEIVNSKKELYKWLRTEDICSSDPPQNPNDAFYGLSALWQKDITLSEWILPSVLEMKDSYDT